MKTVFGGWKGAHTQSTQITTRSEMPSPDGTSQILAIALAGIKFRATKVAFRHRERRSNSLPVPGRGPAGDYGLPVVLARTFSSWGRRNCSARRG
jgi:hypothetical protein